MCGVSFRTFYIFCDVAFNVIAYKSIYIYNIYINTLLINQLWWLFQLFSHNLWMIRVDLSNTVCMLVGEITVSRSVILANNCVISQTSQL